MVTCKKLLYKLLYCSGTGMLANIFLRHPYCSILAYHRVCPLKDQDSLFPHMFTSPEIFEKQMRYLTQKNNIIPLEGLISALLEGRTIKDNSIVITFDDGYEDNYLYALPILRKYLIPATIFVSTSFVSGERLFWWDRLSFLITNSDEPDIPLKFRESLINLNLLGLKNKIHSFKKIAGIIKGLSILEEDRLLGSLESLLNITKKADYPKVLNWSQLEEMLNYDISVGTHTNSHRALSCLNKESFEQEMILSRDILENKLKRKIEYIAYPYGEDEYLSLDSVNAVKNLGYKAGLTTKQGFVFSGDNIFLLRRIGIGGNNSQEEFVLKLKGIVPLLRSKGQREWHLK